MRVEWDERKAAENLRKHGIAFEEVAGIFTSPLLVARDDRFDYGELRWIGVGLLEGRVVVVAFTEREAGSVVRIISARKASSHERKAYEQFLQDRLGAR